MSRTIERLNDLTSALGESIQPHDIRELRLTSQQDVRQFPAVRRWAAGRWASPVLAAASVLVLAIAVTVLGQLASRQTSTSPAGPPRFLVISENGLGYVKLVATGRTIARIPSPVKGFYIMGIAAQPGDRVFYLVGTTTAARGGRTAFFRVKLGPDGHPRPPRRLSVPAVSVPGPIATTRLNASIAVSPDGTEIAYSWPAVLLGLPLAKSTKIFVRNLVTGAVRAWSVPNNGRTEISDLSWAAGGKLSYVATIGGATVRNGFVVSDRHYDLTVLAILDTLRPAGQLLAASRLITYSSESVSTSGVEAGPFNGVVEAVIAPGGRIVIAWLFVGDDTNELAELSATTGKVIRVLFSGRAPVQADPITVDGDHVLLRLLRNEPNGNSICWRLATANLARGGISYLPLPTFCSGQSPPPLAGSW